MLGPSAADQPSFKWYNAHSKSSWISSPLQLLDLVRKIGVTDEWAFLVVLDPKGEGRPFIQSCGLAPNRLAFEVGLNSNWGLVARLGERLEPSRDIGTPGWPCRVSADETHDDRTIAQMGWDWLTLRSIAAGYEVRWSEWRDDPLLGAR